MPAAVAIAAPTARARRPAAAQGRASDPVEASEEALEPEPEPEPEPDPDPEPDVDAGGTADPPSPEAPPLPPPGAPTVTSVHWA
jgi:hypothetical protein